MGMLAPRRDDVSNIHRRWSVTRINPSSSRISYTIWIGCALIIVVVSHVYNLQAGTASLALYIPLSLVLLVGFLFLEYFATPRNPVQQFFKNGTLFGIANVFWLLTLLLGIAADF